MASAMNDDALVSTHPIEVEVNWPSEVDQIFDAISYDKGAAVIHMLISHIGMDAFRKGINIYLERHKYNNTVTKDLWRALEEGGGKDCEGIMEMCV